MAVKDLLPLGARRALKWAGYAALDVIKPVSEARIPPRRRTSIGGGDFKTIGDGFARRLRKAGLKPDHCLLDVGCGQGRMARPLVPYLTGGRYEGFDIDAGAIAWCQDAYSDVSNFTFSYLDIFNARYNPDGAKERVIFPFTDALFDAVLVTSVFTHMFEEDIANYLSEISRVLEPGGFALLTAFLKADGPGRLGFHHTLGENSWTTLPDMPEAAIAVDEFWFRERLADVGLNIQTLDRGSCWDGGTGNVQDVMVVEKAR